MAQICSKQIVFNLNSRIGKRRAIVINEFWLVAFTKFRRVFDDPFGI